MRIPFFVRRPWLMLGQWFTNRDHPPIEKLRAIEDPESFVWAVLPHAARTFAACIALLPANKARAGAVGYLYCRILDTYEDLAPDPKPLLRAFASRFDGDTIAPAPGIEAPTVQDARDEGHLLLLEKVGQIDAMFRSLSPLQQETVLRCVRAMAEGMAEDDLDVLSYCRVVLGNPTVFGMELLLERELQPDERETCMRVGEMVQLANITRDVEKDRDRGVAYDDRPPDEARAYFLDLALERVPDFGAMLAMLQRPWFHLGRASGFLMLLFTDRYYEKLARRLGHEGWGAVRSTFWMLLLPFPASVSHRFTMKRAKRIADATSAWRSDHPLG